MEELAKQTAQNQSLEAELTQLKEEKAQRKTALRGPSLPPRTPPNGGKGAAATGEAAEEGAAREPTAEEAAAQRAEAEALKEAAAEFQSVQRRMDEVAAQRQRLLEGAKDIKWQLRRLDPHETLEQRSSCGKRPPPCLRTAPHHLAGRLLGPRLLLRTPERRLSSLEARRGLSSPPRAAPKLRISHLRLTGRGTIRTSSRRC